MRPVSQASSELSLPDVPATHALPRPMAPPTVLTWSFLVCTFPSSPESGTMSGAVSMAPVDVKVKLRAGFSQTLLT